MHHQPRVILVSWVSLANCLGASGKAVLWVTNHCIYLNVIRFSLLSRQVSILLKSFPFRFSGQWDNTSRVEDWGSEGSAPCPQSLCLWQSLSGRPRQDLVRTRVSQYFELGMWAQDSCFKWHPETVCIEHLLRTCHCVCWYRKLSHSDLALIPQNRLVGTGKLSSEG